MKTVMDRIRQGRDFLGEVRNELLKSSWPTRNELLESTAVVILSVIVFCIFVGVSDTILASLIRLIAR
jgi:preprotein translocase subunit SecE